MTDCLNTVDFSVENVDEFIYLYSNWNNKVFADVVHTNAADMIGDLGYIIQCLAKGDISKATGMLTAAAGEILKQVFLEIKSKTNII